jgi:hypothetical protein
MIQNAEAAKYVSDLFLDINERLGLSLEKIEAACTPEEFQTYKRRLGTILYSTCEEILLPIYRKHPKLKPPAFEI